MLVCLHANRAVDEMRRKYAVRYEAHEGAR